MFIAATVIGAFGIGINLLIYQQKTKIRLLIFKLISDVVWAVHYLLLFAYSGLAIACIGILRELVFIKVDRRSRAGTACFIFFVIVTVASAVITWQSFYSLLPAIASIIAVISYYIAIPKLTRRFSFPISVLMGTYDVFVLSYTGIVNEILMVISSIIGIIRLDKKRATPEADKPTEETESIPA